MRFRSGPAFQTSAPAGGSNFAPIFPRKNAKISMFFGGQKSRWRSKRFLIFFHSWGGALCGSFGVRWVATEESAIQPEWHAWRQVPLALACQTEGSEWGCRGQVGARSRQKSRTSGVKKKAVATCYWELIDKSIVILVLGIARVL